MAEEMEAKQALIDAIAEMAPHAPTSKQLLELAEAWAWCHRPNQSHGGGSVTVTK
jgi:hypothetical protein